MNPLTTYELLVIAVGIAGVYTKLQMDLAKLKGRVITLEQREGEVKQMLGELLTAIQEVKLLLARNGME